MSIERPKPKLTNDAKWCFEDDFWFVKESDDVCLSSDGDSVIVTECAAISFDAHNILALLDHAGALDEYMKRRTM